MSIDLKKLTADMKKYFYVDEEFDDVEILPHDTSIEGNSNMVFGDMVSICKAVGQENIKFDKAEFSINLITIKELGKFDNRIIINASDIYISSDGFINFWYD